MNAGRHRLLATAALLLSAAGAAALTPTLDRPDDAARAQSTVVILVRHAEKADEPADDPPLTPAGEARAAALADAVANAAVDAVYATRFARARLTAEPAARRAGVSLSRLEYAGDAADFARAFADMVLREHRGHTVLAVTHSNTVPLMIEALGAAPVEPIEDHQYEGFYTIWIGDDGQALLVKTRYGAPDPQRAGK